MRYRASRFFLVGLILVGLIFSGFAAFGVSRAMHPNLAAAQGLIERALSRLSTAQAANEFDMGGHAAKAKALLAEAFAEIKLAAAAANAR